MSSVVEKLMAEGERKGAMREKTATILHLLKMGRFTLEDMAEITRISLDEVKAIIAKNMTEAQGEGAK